ncbi:MMPL family transporter [Actinoplanes sp. NBRC 103695]|uniref:MMPL family transporter n=1 Tax=Actinoplanes sp. NBRC 103695 TaxID=3032202 RepID=UPI0024A00EF3|nr:MMPL family transporter [Actinoplanes sp. NBRC 103695]GLY94087.1 membrane protein [Actinoplanes sp. NBRC 103695]
MWSGTPTNGLEVPGTEAQVAIDTLRREFPQAGGEGASAQVVVSAHEGQKLTDPANAAAVSELVSRLGGSPQVVDVAALDERSTSPDGRFGIIDVSYGVDGDELTTAAQDGLTAALEGARTAGLTAEAGGNAVEGGQPELGNAEIIGVIVAALVLLLTFGSMVAAGLPLLTAILGVVIGFTGIGLVSAVVDMPSAVSTLALMLGLAVGIDYALFITSRYRSELAKGHDPEEAAGRAVGTAGSAVVFAGLTVIIALVGLMVVNVPFLTVMGLGSAGVVAVAVLIALTLLPALFGFAGRRIFGRRARRAPAVVAGEQKMTLGRRWVMMVLRRPVIAVVAGVAVLGIAAIPAMDLRLGLPDDGTAAADSSPRKAYDLTAQGFGPGYNGQLTIVVDGADADAVSATVAALPGVAGVSPARASESGTVSIFQVIPTTGPNDPATTDLVNAIRAATADVPGGDVSVTGITAVNIDASATISDSLLPYLALIVGLAFLLLLVVFRSVLVPIKATLGFLLTIGATFGTMVAVFQWGWLNGLLGVPATGPIVSMMPIFIIGIAFGLAMDYEVFLVTRMREEHVAGAEPRAAIIDGFSASSRVVTAAAVIMISIFSGFMLSPDLQIKMPGLGLATAVLVDAFLVRMTIVPAVLALLGRSAWSLPAWLDRILPNLDVEGSALHTPTPPVTEEEDSAPAVELAR